MKKAIVNLCRLLLAAVFILSGFVKAVDPLGTLYKMQDYLLAMDLGGWLPDLALLARMIFDAIMKSAAGTPLPETSAITIHRWSSSIRKKS